MTSEYNSAYVQTETLNFTFARQAVNCVFWCQMLNINVGLLAGYFFANNVGLYINSKQTIHMTVAYFVWVTMIWHFLTAIWR